MTTPQHQYHPNQSSSSTPAVHLQQQQKKSSEKPWKLLTDPQLHPGHTHKLYRVEGVIQTKVPKPDPTVTVLKDPRTGPRRIPNQLHDAAVLPLPKFKKDDCMVLDLLAKEVTISNINDNINSAGLRDMCLVYGTVEEAKVYTHPKTKRHLGIGKVLFTSTRAANECLSRMHGASKMGNKVSVYMDTHGILRKKMINDIIKHRTDDGVATSSTLANKSDSSSTSGPIYQTRPAVGGHVYSDESASSTRKHRHPATATNQSVAHEKEDLKDRLQKMLQFTSGPPIIEETVAAPPPPLPEVLPSIPPPPLPTVPPTPQTFSSFFPESRMFQPFSIHQQKPVSFEPTEPKITIGNNGLIGQLVLDGILGELRSVFARDITKRAVEQMAFQDYDNWWNFHSNRYSGKRVFNPNLQIADNSCQKPEVSDKLKSTKSVKSNTYSSLPTTSGGGDGSGKLANLFSSMGLSSLTGFSLGKSGGLRSSLPRIQRKPKPVSSESSKKAHRDDEHRKSSSIFSVGLKSKLPSTPLSSAAASSDEEGEVMSPAKSKSPLRKSERTVSLSSSSSSSLEEVDQETTDVKKESEVSGKLVKEVFGSSLSPSGSESDNEETEEPAVLPAKIEKKVFTKIKAKTQTALPRNTLFANNRRKKGKTKKFVPKPRKQSKIIVASESSDEEHVSEVCKKVSRTASSHSDEEDSTPPAVEVNDDDDLLDGLDLGTESEESDLTPVSSSSSSPVASSDEKQDEEDEAELATKSESEKSTKSSVPEFKPKKRRLSSSSSVSMMSQHSSDVNEFTSTKVTQRTSICGQGRGGSKSSRPLISQRVTPDLRVVDEIVMEEPIVQVKPDTHEHLPTNDVELRTESRNQPYSFGPPDFAQWPRGLTQEHNYFFGCQKFLTVPTVSIQKPLLLSSNKRKLVPQGIRELAGLLDDTVAAPPSKVAKVEMWFDRSLDMELQITKRILSGKISLEEVRYLRRCFRDLVEADNGLDLWISETCWYDHCSTDGSLQQGVPHSSGSARTEGFYRQTNKSLTCISNHNVMPGNATSLVQHKSDTRDARSLQRRILAEFGDLTTSDLLKFNQLKFRKKGLKFDRSGIHSWGLFALETIAADEMVIEYTGQVIRRSVAEAREVQYEKSGIGSSYLFRVDDVFVIDATKCGNNARFINHSCNPNCYAKIITVDNQKKIVIYSKREIKAQEEITYDYKFPYEDDKIPCLCGSSMCRGYLN